MGKSRSARPGRRLPDATIILDPVLRSYLFDLTQALDDVDKNVPNLPLSSGIYLTSVSPSYMVSSGSTTVEIAEVLGTLINDLKNAGVLK